MSDSSTSIIRSNHPRGRLLIDKEFQLNYCFSSLCLSYGFALLVAVLSVLGTCAYYAYIETGLFFEDVAAQRTVMWFLGVGLILIFGMIALIIKVSFWQSHRIAGAIYRMQEDLKKVAAGELDTVIVLRGKDHFKSFATDINVVIMRLNQTFQDKELVCEQTLTIINAIKNGEHGDQELVKQADELLLLINNMSGGKRLFADNVQETQDNPI